MGRQGRNIPRITEIIKRRQDRVNQFKKNSKNDRKPNKSAEKADQRASEKGSQIM